MAGTAASALTTAQPIRWVKLTLPPRWRRRWPLSTLRLTSRSLAGTVRTEVAVGTARLASIASTMRAAAPRSGTMPASALPSPLAVAVTAALALPSPSGRFLGPASTRPLESVSASAAGLLRVVLGEEVPPGLAHRLRVVQVLPVDLVDQPDVGAELRPIEPSHQPCTTLGIGSAAHSGGGRRPADPAAT